MRYEAQGSVDWVEHPVDSPGGWYEGESVSSLGNFMEFAWAWLRSPIFTMPPST